MNLAFHSLLAVVPVAAGFFFLVIPRWPARKAMPVAWLVTVLVAVRRNSGGATADLL